MILGTVPSARPIRVAYLLSGVWCDVCEEVAVRAERFHDEELNLCAKCRIDLGYSPIVFVPPPPAGARSGAVTGR